MADLSGRVSSWTPTPREGCPERCQGHYAPCEHRTGYAACPDCVRQRTKDGPVFCWACPHDPTGSSPYACACEDA